jgi:L-alanine-DL-glutamate epimerase-like enolase superfamily enzyme
MIQLEVATERFPIAGQFTIARGSKTEAAVVVVSLSDSHIKGRGECVPYNRYGETLESVSAQIESVRQKIENGATRSEIQNLLPPGAARNAVDCALWDFESKKNGKPVYELAGISAPRPVTTAYTISLGSVESMREATRKAKARPILKVKLGAPEGDIERIYAIREEAPDAVLIADANEGWTESNILAHLEACKSAKFSLVEQPLPAKQDQFLAAIPHPVAICADESVHGVESIDRLKGLYEFVNIKLDKTGGLTEALAMVRAAREKNFKIMVGCMVGTSLAMAPAMLLSSDAEFIDLDGPLLLSKDREGGLKFEGSRIFPPERNLWG